IRQASAPFTREVMIQLGGGLISTIRNNSADCKVYAAVIASRTVGQWEVASDGLADAIEAAGRNPIILERIAHDAIAHRARGQRVVDDLQRACSVQRFRKIAVTFGRGGNWKFAGERVSLAVAFAGKPKEGP